MDAITLLTDDHRDFAALLERYRAAQSQRLRGDLAARLLQEIQLHIRLEEKYVYPIAIERSGAQLDEHEHAKRSLTELLALDVADRQFGPKLLQLVEEVIAHSQEEERLFFPALRASMRRSELEALGRLIQNAREIRPDLPAENLMARAVTHVVGAWKHQLEDAVGRMCSAALRMTPSNRTTHP